jgi:pilus assembly protein CpaE
MQTAASILPFGKLELGVKLLFYSPDEQRAHRLSARLRNVATVHWQDNRHFSPEQWTQLQNDHRLVLLDYACETADASTSLARRLSALSANLPLIGVGSPAADRAAGVLAALRAGVRDFIDMDASDEEIHTLLSQALKNAETQQTPPTPAIRKPGQLVLLWGVRPGVGTSTLAAHLGALSMPAKSAGTMLSDTIAPHTLLLDLGAPHGDAALYVGAKGDFHYEDALRHATRIDATLIRTAIPHHRSGLAVISQTQEQTLNTAETSALIDRLLTLFELVLCDLGGRSLQQLSPQLLKSANEIWLVADQGIASMVSLDTCLHQLAQHNARDRRVSLIVNRHDEECGISARQIAERFELPLLAALPDRSRALRSSANQGLLLHQMAPKDAYIHALTPLLAKLHIGAEDHTESSRWKRLFHHKGDHRWKTP